MSVNSKNTRVYCLHLSGLKFIVNNLEKNLLLWVVDSSFWNKEVGRYSMGGKGQDGSDGGGMGVRWRRGERGSLEI